MSRDSMDHEYVCALIEELQRGHEAAIQTHPAETARIYGDNAGNLVKSVVSAIGSTICASQVALVCRFIVSSSFISAWYHLTNDIHRRNEATSSCCVLSVGALRVPAPDVLSRFVECELRWRALFQPSPASIALRTESLRRLKLARTWVSLWDRLFGRRRNLDIQLADGSSARVSVTERWLYDNARRAPREARPTPVNAVTVHILDIARKLPKRAEFSCDDIYHVERWRIGVQVSCSEYARYRHTDGALYAVVLLESGDRIVQLSTFGAWVQIWQLFMGSRSVPT